ncbi:uncharacterized protein LOC124362275 isoform X2 [Homalodisca vitripennis]|uniref:uncharacterized protein LOC124362275 isoform X2 n=1 Tax=Homalodisca vitripennis TaxID=197043 RepID=UPI001EEA6B1C|nr:uncharacterized protein LOC124362275 isoform X2 [Homalodisca vitripennis]
MKSTPILALQMEAAVPNLQTRRKMLTERLVFKVLSEPNHPVYVNLKYLSMAANHHEYWAKKTTPLYIKSGRY